MGFHQGNNKVRPEIWGLTAGEGRGPLGGKTQKSSCDRVWPDQGVAAEPGVG